MCRLPTSPVKKNWKILSEFAEFGVGKRKDCGGSNTIYSSKFLMG
jgi:hypothetical protein